ncbi:MAG: hypothetical protein EBQ89_10105 [Alphaproteobacteria bacterium]|nr:hypothetical protein [Alphaproteobacteria bacterium]
MAGLSACGSTETTQPLVAENDPVMVRLADAADKATKALNDIASIQRLQDLPVAAPDLRAAPPILQQPLTLTWDGPVETIVAMLAERAGYRFITSGRAPPMPITISLDVYDKPLVYVLYDIGLQLGQRAELIIDGQRQHMEVRYAAVDQFGQ